jgi:hypothetical protein
VRSLLRQHPDNRVDRSEQFGVSTADSRLCGDTDSQPSDTSVESSANLDTLGLPLGGDIIRIVDHVFK